ncbi:protein of unknown function (DUF1992) [Chthonomonas calidirosea]|uniref:DnaJ homologue subfamily C member 28 conserved domain-containing protein n=1 Tax=Chthonomonas calidirosea (strain DSM 23976 / ICMP 18418 / T49) TaxID=1303518 RepID=S0EUX6_CHTCT|nr:DUF1992 domain-containing protein [Chthonomonas calidirosea]CCW35523.1 Domain of unknown function (DUF1992) [Chthonomonas calidirosea T49]CEK19016.1 protein of unknown function (DUF1992) [Chthonomonas calidirosea]CEK20019.1 protein of unknown function (DUF1992) [Chthonomonas calidirosea]
MFDPDVIALIAERKIQEAIEQGKFDNLPGKGKPLVLEEEAIVPPHLRVANHALRNVGALPEWVQLLKEIVSLKREIALLRAQLITQSRRRRFVLSSARIRPATREAYLQWCVQMRALYQQRLCEVNLLVLRFSLIAPPSQVDRALPYRVVVEMEAFDTEFLPCPLTALPELSSAIPLERKAPDIKEGFLRRLMRIRYRHLQKPSK